MENTSGKYQLNQVDWFKTGRGLLIVLAGAGLTYLVDFVAELDLGVYTALLVPFFGSLIELARRWIANYSANRQGNGL